MKDYHFVEGCGLIFAILPPEATPQVYASESVPPFFRNRRVSDVTNLYLPTSDIVVSNLFPSPEDNAYVYLCVFDDKEWNAVGCAPVKNGVARFEKAATVDAVYLPAYYVNGRYVAAQHPLRFGRESQAVSLVPDTLHRQTVSLSRKYYETRVNLFLGYLRGNFIDLSNDKDFKNSIPFQIPTDAASNYQQFPVAGSYRYVRFRPALGRIGQLAELEVYDSRDSLITNAQVIDNEASKPERIADGNTLTYTDCNAVRNPGSWEGLDLGSPTPLSKIAYLGRTDDNFIKEGEEYELCYFDNGWHSLGRRTGRRRTQRLVYRNVPSNALLLLHNLTKGTEERIFIYENDKQVWF